MFTGEDVEEEEKSFEQWFGRFEERAQLLNWSEEQKCYQLKLHLAIEQLCRYMSFYLQRNMTVFS